MFGGWKIRVGLLLWSYHIFLLPKILGNISVSTIREGDGQGGII